MFREMRRRKQQITDEECIAILKSERRGVLAMIGDGGYPYAIPVNYLYDAQRNKIYIHCAREGHKIDALRACGKVCFTVWNEGRLEEGSWWYHVESVVVFGRAELVADEEETLRSVRALGEKYFPDAQTLEHEMSIAAHRVQMIAITPEHMTGKHVKEN